MSFVRSARIVFIRRRYSSISSHWMTLSSCCMRFVVLASNFYCNLWFVPNFSCVLSSILVLCEFSYLIFRDVFRGLLPVLQHFYLFIYHLCIFSIYCAEQGFANGRYIMFQIRICKWREKMCSTDRYGGNRKKIDSPSYDLSFIR